MTSNFAHILYEKTRYGVVRWGFQIDDESHRKGGIKIIGLKLPYAPFEFYPTPSPKLESGSQTIGDTMIQEVPAPRYLDVEVVSFWSLISPERRGQKWFHTMFKHAQKDNITYSNICQAVALKIPSKLTKRSSYKATLTVNIADEELKPKRNVRVNYGEVGMTSSIVRAQLLFRPVGERKSFTSTNAQESLR